MAEVSMSVNLIAHTQLSRKYLDEILEGNGCDMHGKYVQSTDGQAVALTAIRTCYSPNKPSEIVAKEGAKYFGTSATDGEGGTEADRLIRTIVRSKHTSTLEHLTYTFAIKGVSRALLAQLTRHRVGFSFSVQSQRYVKFGSDDKSGGFDYVVPDSIANDETKYPSSDYGDYYVDETRRDQFEEVMGDIQFAYDRLRKMGVPAEDARAVLPNASATNLVMTVNLRSLLDFYAKRRKGNGAQGEIAELAERLRESVVEVEHWTDAFFE